MSIEIIKDNGGHTIAAIVDLLDGTFAVFGERGIPLGVFDERWQAEQAAEHLLCRARGRAALKQMKT